MRLNPEARYCGPATLVTNPFFTSRNVSGIESGAGQGTKWRFTGATCCGRSAQGLWYKVLAYNSEIRAPEISKKRDVTSPFGKYSSFTNPVLAALKIVSGLFPKASFSVKLPEMT